MNFLNWYDRLEKDNKDLKPLVKKGFSKLYVETKDKSLLISELEPIDSDGWSLNQISESKFYLWLERKHYDNIITSLSKSEEISLNPVFISELGLTEYIPSYSIIVVLKNQKDVDKLSRLFGEKRVIDKVENFSTYLIKLDSIIEVVKVSKRLKSNKPDWINSVEINISTIEKEYINTDEAEIFVKEVNNNQKMYQEINLVDKNFKRMYYGNHTLKIGVFDVGVDKSHLDIKAAVHDLNGYNALNDTYEPKQLNHNHHGSKCAGLIVGTDSNTTGVQGIAFGSKILDYQIGYNYKGLKLKLDYFRIVKSIDKAVFFHKVDVVNISWGLDTRSEAIANAIKIAMKRGRNSKGTIFVAAVGNSGSKVAFPANMKNVIGVTAVNEDNEPIVYKNGWKSNYGMGADIAAPGEHLVSCKNWISDSDLSLNYTHNFNGTSSAAPIITGVVSLMLSKKPELSIGDVRKILLNSENLKPINQDSQSKNYGKGVIDVNKVMNAIV